MFIWCSSRHEFQNPHSFTNVNVDCFCSQYIFLNTIRRTIFQVWGLYHKAFLNFAGIRNCWRAVVQKSIHFPTPSFFPVYNSKVAKLVLSKLPQIFTFGSLLKKKKKFYLLRIAFCSFTREFNFTSALTEYSQLFSSIFISNILQAKLKARFILA